MFKKSFIVCSSLLLLAGCSSSKNAVEEVQLLNVSYDPTRELYEDINQSFSHKWYEETGQKVKIQQSHGGSGKQGRAIIDGIRADVATLALAYDIDEISKHRLLIPKDWQSEKANHSAPYTSTIVFLVRKGNPKNIKDWADLIRSDVSVITPNPKTSGGARWNYLAALSYAKEQHLDEFDFMKKLYKNVEILDSGARGSTTTFAEREIGDVLITWENEAYLTLKEMRDKGFEIITPSISILAEPPVTVIQKNSEKRGTTKVANAYLDFLYTTEGQKIIAENHYRPRNKEILKSYRSQFPQLHLKTIDDFGGWQKAQEAYFADQAQFDQLYEQGGKP